MHLHKRLIITVIAVLASTSALTANAQAAKHQSTATVYSVTTSHTRKVKVTGGTLYTSTRLTKKKANLSKTKYRKLTYTTSKTYGLKKSNGKKAIYNYIKSTNGRAKGYVWHGYLKPVTKKTAAKAKTSTTSPRQSLTLSTTDYRNAFLTGLNAERAKRHLATLSANDSYNAIAQQRSQQLLTSFAHEDAQGNFIADDLFTAQGVPGLSGECISMDYLDEDVSNPSQDTAKRDLYEYIYDDADSNWGHRDILLAADAQTVGIGATQKGASVYGAIETGN